MTKKGDLKSFCPVFPEKTELILNKIILLFAVFCLTTGTLRAQEKETNNIVFGEAGGNGLLLSINYERFLTHNLSVRTGFGTGLLFLINVPLMINYYVGDIRKLELGAGIIYIDYLPADLMDETGPIVLTFTIGHSFHPLNGGFILRFSFTPMYSFQIQKFIPWGGISVGYKF